MTFTGAGTVIINDTLDPQAPDTGILNLNSVNAGEALTVSAGVSDVTIGTADNNLNKLIFSGAGEFNIEDVGIFVKNIGVNSTTPIVLDAISGNLTFGANGQVIQSGDIGGFVDFNGNNAKLTLEDGVDIGGAVQNTGGTSNGTIIVEGNSVINGFINGLAMLQVGAGDVSISEDGGNNSIAEIQGNGTNTLIFGENFKLTGSINKTGGQALKLDFANSSVSDVVGTAVSPVGDIELNGTLNSFSSSIYSNGNITLAEESINNFAGDVTAAKFIVNNNAAMSFSNNLALNSDIEASNGSSIVFNSSQVTYTGNASFEDVLNIYAIYDGATQSGGSILIKSGSSYDLSKVSLLNLILEVENEESIPTGAQYKLIIAETDGGFNPTTGNIKLTINGEEDTDGVKITRASKSLTLNFENLRNEAIEEEFKGQSDAEELGEALGEMKDAPNGSDANEAFKNLKLLNTDQKAEALRNLVQNVVNPSEVVSAINQAVMGNISTNLTMLSSRLKAMQPVSSGDECDVPEFGGWQVRLLVMQHRKDVIILMVISRTQKVVLSVLMQWLEMI